MKKAKWTLAAAGLMLLAPFQSQAHDYDRDDSDYWLRYVAYALHPIGYAADHLVLRPIHCLVSWNETTNHIFGHDSQGKYCCDKSSSVEMTLVQENGQAVAPGTDPTGAPLERTEITGVSPARDMNIIYFDYDKSLLRGDQMDRMEKNLQYLQANPTLKVLVEGHCDERGTNEYNLALGERRAQEVVNYLSKNGIAADRMILVSKGEEEPAAQGHDESAWSQNRRVEFDKVD